MVASVIICTFDRPHLLSRALATCYQEASTTDSAWEVILVDNGGKPATLEVVARFAERLPLRVVREPVPGKSRALNTGIKAAQGSLLLFADDDVELRPGWMGAFLAAARRFPEAGWFGGRSVPRWAEGAPAWTRSEVPQALRGYCCLYDLECEARLYTADDLLPIGACMAVRASTLACVGGFETTLGPRGRDRGVGEDTEFLERARAQGIEGCYVPEAVVDHYVPSERLRPAAYFRYGVLKGRQQALKDRRPARRIVAMGRASSQLARGLVQLALGRVAQASVCWLNVGLAIGSANGEHSVSSESDS